MQPVARRIAETARPAAWLGLPLGRLGRLGRLTARPARSASATGRPWAVPAGSGLSRTVRTATGIPGAVLTRTRARLSRTARPHWPGSSASSGPARRGLTVAGARVAGPVRSRVPWSEFARARSVRVPARRIGTRAAPGYGCPAAPLARIPGPYDAEPGSPAANASEGNAPGPNASGPAGPACAAPNCSRPVLLGPVRARPVLFGAMLVRPVPVSAVLPGAALLRPILLSAVRLRTVLVRPVPAGVVLLRPVLLWPALHCSGPYCSGAGLVLLSPVLL